MTALVLVLVLYGVLAAVLFLLALAAPSRETGPAAEDSVTSLGRIERLWWLGVEPPIPIRRCPRCTVLTYAYT